MAGNSVGRELASVVSRHNPAAVTPVCLPLPGGNGGAGGKAVKAACEHRCACDAYPELHDFRPGCGGEMHDSEAEWQMRRGEYHELPVAGGMRRAAEFVNSLWVHVLIDAQGWGKG